MNRVKIGVTFFAALIILFLNNANAYPPDKIIGGSFAIPDDMCYNTDGLPVVLASSFLVVNGLPYYTFTYMTKSGTIVSTYYRVPAFSYDYEAQDYITITGGKCPTQ